MSQINYSDYFIFSHISGNTTLDKTKIDKKAIKVLPSGMTEDELIDIIQTSKDYSFILVRNDLKRFFKKNV